MGGLIGKLSFEREETLAHPALEQMLAAVRHRGADSRGLHTAPGIALGRRGDEHSAGPVVASNEARSVVAVADAALANAAGLRHELTRAGHLLCRSSNAELLAHAYLEWGDRLVERIQGPFAFAIWDARARRLLLARDHAGTRPLFYAVLQGHGVVFASTIRALLADPGVGREWCPAALDAYLVNGHVPGPLTPYRRISKLEPGHRLIVDGRRFHIEPFAAPRSDITADSVETSLGRILTTVPAGTGVLFSGGPASTTLLTQAVRTCAASRAVIVGLDQDTRELARAYAAARELGADPVVDVAPRDFSRLMADVAATADEPNADPALVADYAVCLTASRHLEAAITGHGAATRWCERLPEPGPWAGSERFGVYTRRFARELLQSMPDGGADTRVAGAWAAVAAVGTEAGITLSFPYLDSRLGTSAPPAGDHPLRQPTAHTPHDGRRAASERRRSRYPWLHDTIRTSVPWLLLGGRFDGRGVLSPAALRQLWEDHRLGRRDHTRRFWSLLMLELWFREFVDGGANEAPLEYALARAA